ncbi:hypothetical protein UCMB321_5668 [Pseudomonas batumici]|uniref:Uncharacterized protein n=1 Tax=Pseudomonas batumici TaxID=226910 RepID=A0A0C2E482_9PSED|nr:hypothetical protein UCMB321_5668 [Pseudomonas batumici]
MSGVAIHLLCIEKYAKSECLKSIKPGGFGSLESNFSAVCEHSQ